MEPGEVAVDENCNNFKTERDEFETEYIWEDIPNYGSDNSCNSDSKSLTEYIEPTYTIHTGVTITEDSSSDDALQFSLSESLPELSASSLNAIEADLLKNEPIGNFESGETPLASTEASSTQPEAVDSFLVCSQCNYTSKRKYIMKNHILSQHFGIRHQCQQCTYKAKSKDKLTAHVKRVHLRQKSNKSKSKSLHCVLCNFKTSRPYDLKIHKQGTHEGVRYKCEICSFSGKRKDLLNRHMKIKHPWEIEAHPTEFVSDNVKSIRNNNESLQNKENSESQNSPDTSLENPVTFLEVDFEETNLGSVECKTAESDIKLELNEESDINKQHLPEVQEKIENQTLDWMSFAKVVTSTGSNVQVSDVFRTTKVENNKMYFCNQCDFSDTNCGRVTKHKDREHNSGIPLQCEHCDFQSPFRDAFFRHKKTHKELIYYYCDLCDYKGPKKSYVQQHKRTSHSGIKYPCDKCEYQAKSKQYLRLHIQSKHEGIRYQCDKCDYKATTVGNLKIHEETHLDNVYQCNLCDYKSNRLYNYKSHVQTRHENKKFPCKYCVFEGNSKSSLRSHKLNYHADILNKPWFYCDQCDYHTPKKDLLKRHVGSQHEGLRYSCSQCGFSAAQKSGLLRHVQNKHEERTYPCDLCDYEARDRFTLKSHLIAKHRQSGPENSSEGQDMYFCAECEYQSSNKNYLKLHIEKIHQGIRRYRCPQCDYKTNRQTYLYSHLLTIHEGRRFKCDLCDFQTVQMDALHAHIRSFHDGQFPLSCDYDKCNFQTTREQYLLNHELIKHNRAAGKAASFLEFIGHEMTDETNDCVISETETGDT